MTTSPESKVTARHLARTAYLYVRQSSLRQVLEHTESTARQYALRQRAIALGWPAEQIVVIDCDQGLSGASASIAPASRIWSPKWGSGTPASCSGWRSRAWPESSADWHRLLELCALSGTLILDEDGLYDPSQFNDRLLLGLKGTMSEAELHVLRARLIGGVLNKARRGELKLRLPVGLAMTRSIAWCSIPTSRCSTRCDCCSARSAALARPRRRCAPSRRRSLLFPRRRRYRAAQGRVVCGSTAVQPRTEIRCTIRATPVPSSMVATAAPDRDRPPFRTLPRDEWQVLIRDAHPGYITWDEYEENLQRLSSNAWAFGADRRAGPPREGPALLQGLVICGRCGERMTVRYHRWAESPGPGYVCKRETSSVSTRVPDDSRRDLTPPSASCWSTPRSALVGNDVGHSVGGGSA